MDKNALTMQGFVVQASDGKLGKVTDLFLDDRQWRIIYLVVVDSAWLSSKKILLPVGAIDRVSWGDHVIHAHGAQKDLLEQAGPQQVQTVSRAHALILQKYHRWPYYWRNVGHAPQTQSISDILSEEKELANRSIHEDDTGERLRSVKEMHGYHVQTVTGPAGKVVDFLFEEQSWTVRYLNVDTGTFFHEKDVLVSVNRVRRISWGDKSFILSIGRDEVKKAAA